MLPNYLDNICETWELVGSRITCNPPPTDTDQDILILLTKEQWPTFLQELEANHWEKCVGKQAEHPPHPGPPSNYADVAAWDAAMDLWDAACDQLDSYSDIGDGATFEAWRLGELNVILTMDEFWFDKFMEASDCCKALNVMSKAERIAIFERIVPKSKPVEKKVTPVIDYNQAINNTTVSLNQWIQGSFQSNNPFAGATFITGGTYDF